MNIEKKKFCCIYISSRDEIYYFDIILENNDLSKIVNKLNNDLNINYRIKKYFVDKKYGILFMDNLRVKKSNLLKYTNCKINLNYSKKLLELYNYFILNNSIDEK